ncbi:uncharacterized protein P884DRAFT_311398 [Thermothelomyces heterothallicus CBS 202.75]|uniref:uncharacterized protein n=1 Tax=Thermothelomyces heterothallicus CBS 202.75 TaxID=1149848 RepID=UPI003743CEE2
MPPGSRRPSTSHQKPSGSMVRQHSSRSAAVQDPIMPTPETQDLYNRWREMEDQLTAESLSQIPNDHAAFLYPPSPSQATTHSQTSTAYSIAQSMDDTDARDPSRPDKPKRGRQGPLTGPKKLKTNLMRKLKACKECRERRVECTHRNLTLFEQEYQRRKQARAAADQEINIGPHNLQATLPSQDAPSQQRLGHEADFDGIGTGQIQLSDPSLNPSGRILGGSEDAHTETDLLQDNRIRVRPYVAALLSSFEGTGLPTSTSLPASTHTAAYTATPFMTLTPPQPVDQDKLIGRQRAPRSREWVCHGSCGEFRTCIQPFTDLSSLTRHFRDSHAQFSDQWFSWSCAMCKLDVAETFPEVPPSEPCPQCRDPEPYTWLRCCWGKVANPSAGPQPSFPSRVPSRDGSSSNPSSWTNFSFLGPSGGRYGYSPTMSSSGSLWGYFYRSGGGGGVGQAYYASSPKVPPPTMMGARSLASSSSCARPTLPLLAYFWPLSSRSSSSGTGRPDSKPSSLARRVCPAAVVLAVVALAPLLGRWASPPGSPTLPGDVGIGVVAAERALSGIARSAAHDGDDDDDDDDLRPGIPELSMACIAAGLVASWVFWHVRDRWCGRGRPSRWWGPPPPGEAGQLEPEFEPNPPAPAPARVRVQVQVR